ncbi:L-threonylcarbamoyladenylate synthase [Aliiglaciecola sp. CAU 1673]|uniref:L-threonylcarbamoyladenylate synthase n=1 Tax=Aliiglaciecola sp. CAU 1673 TaxID=3032595 RepID=UPI0023DA9F29|nr:L-threonylcarbamoyladenylate synthase [Aliiglaciecola sp. CAU 1673]MDF2180235.1 L-threonylcarbamoyladenylate synthase [Aliiglaciecola sp. CAU 1673]
MTDTIDTKHLYLRHGADRQVAKSLLLSGKLVAIPTETVYGLAALATNPTAIAAVFAAKQRPLDHPLIVHIGSFSQLDYWVEHVPDEAWRLINEFWPGPLTLLLRKSAKASDAITAGLDTVAVRMPALPELRQLLAELDQGVVAPSANPHKALSPTRAEHVLGSLHGRIDAVLDGGPCDVGLESTIVDLSSGSPRVLRAGPIDADALSQVLGQKVAQPVSHDVKVAGNMRAHYQPNTRLQLLGSAALRHKLSQVGSQSANWVVLHYSELEIPAGITSIKLASQKQLFARHLYDALHQADTLGADEILVEKPPKEGQWMDVWDRLTRASATDL